MPLCVTTYTRDVEPEHTELEQQIAGIASLNEPMRWRLYLYAVGQDRPVTRDEAALALGVSRPLAAFHLDKLVEEGLLEAEYRRLTGRRGPGAGRPSKLYRRSGRQFVITLPPRSYELAARLLARSLDVSHSEEALLALRDVAYDFGESLGSEARLLAGPDADPEHLLHAAEVLLTAYGYEPYRSPTDEIRLRNCPFHDLAAAHRPLVCGMNLALLRGVVDGLQVQGIAATFDPQPGMCCVTFQPVQCAV